MAQTKKKRKRKHRGTQGGSISTRSRGRPRSREEARAQARRQATARKDAAPSWRGAINRALIMSGLLFFLMVVVLGENVAPSAFLAVTMMFIYVPAGYYLERFLWRRRMASEAKKRAAARAAGRGK